MNETYLNCPDSGNPMSAQEFAASLREGGCAGGCPGASASVPGSGCGCGCGGEQTVCCWKVPARPTPPPEVDEGCCCKESFRAALQLLCGTEIAGILDFGATAFLTDTFVAGTTLTVPKEGAQDNLAETLTGTFRRFSPCDCGLLDVSAPLYYPTPGEQEALPFTAAQVPVCALTAVVLQQEEGTAEGDLTAEEVAARNFKQLKRLLSCRLSPCGGCSGGGSCCCEDGECCCARGVLAALAGSNLSRRVTLTAGNLALDNVELLGTVGNVLVLAGDDTGRLYFVCASKVTMIG